MYARSTYSFHCWVDCSDQMTKCLWNILEPIYSEKEWNTSLIAFNFFKYKRVNKLGTSVNFLLQKIGKKQIIRDQFSLCCLNVTWCVCLRTVTLFQLQDVQWSIIEIRPLVWVTPMTTKCVISISCIGLKVPKLWAKSPVSASDLQFILGEAGFLEEA